MIDVDEPKPAAGEVTVSIDLCGVCVTEVRAYSTGAGHGPTLCGHEWTGRLVEVGESVDRLALGQRVVVGVPDPCGDCDSCRAGRPEFCALVMSVARGRDVAPEQPHGGFARLLTVPAYRVVPVPDKVSEVAAALVEPAAVAWHAIRRGVVATGERVLVLGAGPIGLLVVQCARAVGAAEVNVVELSPSRRLAAEASGAHRVAATVTEVSDDHDVVVECTGAPDMVEQALAALRQGGRVVLVGDAGQATISPRMWLAKEVTLIAAAGYTRAEIVETLQLIADRGIEPEKLHTRTVGIGSLADGLAGLTAADTDDIKIVLDPRIKENS
ncbi:alcohol dehydrogenase catalytic domain-containing protein [Rhodococcus oxybenzonivorans]|uniref:zinc-dependent alcohol dehydrogenase n=1 Tax=Rhodococcus oxybenzonivorans TaxID=1990687 RepID=UPI00295594A5|nr:zinc-binding dehydrogenase [Rhodococcus oxybenzonivorans]MDV7352062.1 alcohol dehydrogenase catalytic domain-containing protein [Rhodococcus oxybenzonivorans]